MSNDGYFEKNVFVHERNDKEELLPVDIELEIHGNKGKIKVIPMTKGQIDEMRNKSIENKELMKTNKEEAKKISKQQDKDLIKTHISTPVFDENDFDFFKPKEYVELVKAIMLASGFEKDEINKMFSQLIEESNKEIGDEDKNPKA